MRIDLAACNPRKTGWKGPVPHDKHSPHPRQVQPEPSAVASSMPAPARNKKSVRHSSHQAPRMLFFFLSASLIDLATALGFPPYLAWVRAVHGEGNGQ